MTDAPTVEPELLQSKPRRIRMRNARRTRIAMRWLAVFCFPFVLVGLFILYHAVHGTYGVLDGKTAPGQIDGYDADEDGGAILRYRFQFCGTEYTAEDRYPRETRLPQGSAISVRFDPSAPGHDSKAILPGDSAGQLGLANTEWTIGLTWNSVLILITVFVQKALRKHRHLYTHGDVAVGKITEKVVTWDEGASYRLKYEFTPLAVGLTSRPIQQDVESVSEAEWNSVQEGEIVSVLYDPQRPRNSLLYRFGLYQIEEHRSRTEEVSMVKGTVYDLIPGRRYRVLRDFLDYYQGAFTAGQILTFRHRNFLPYHGGHTIEFEEQNIYLQEDANADVLQDLESYLEPL